MLKTKVRSTLIAHDVCASATPGHTYGTFMLLMKYWRKF